MQCTCENEIWEECRRTVRESSLSYSEIARRADFSRQYISRAMSQDHASGKVVAMLIGAMRNKPE